ncbi:MAG: GNAT family N-acetyltransferase [Cyanobacteria bacterium P01_D01_bin.123]
MYPASCRHVDELADVLTQVFHPAVGLAALVFPLLRAGVREDLKRRLQRDSSQYYCLGAWTSAGLIGTVEIGLRRSRDRGGVRRYPYIANLAVLPRYRRRGAARQLLHAAEDVAKAWGCERIYLHVMEDNRAARRLYHHLDYRLWRARRTFWSALGWPRQMLLCKHLSEIPPC